MEEFLGKGRGWSCSKGEYPLKEWRSSWAKGGVGPVAKENTHRKNGGVPGQREGLVSKGKLFLGRGVCSVARTPLGKGEIPEGE